MAEEFRRIGPLPNRPLVETVDVSMEKEGLIKKGVSCSLKKITTKTLDSLRLQGKDVNTVVLCLLEAVEEKEFQSSGELLTTLGSLYTQQGKIAVAKKFFKHAKSLSGKHSEYIKEWSFLGPFVIGKPEVDGDPVEAFGGIRLAARSRLKKNVKFYSELVPGGEIQWSQIKQAGPNSAVQVWPKVNWNELVNSLGSMGITEWQGWLVGDFAVNEDDLDLVVQCMGVHTVYINDIPVTGDVYHRDKFWYGVELNPGIHTVYIRLRTKISAHVMCKFKTAKSSFELLSPIFLPDLLDGRLFGNYLTFPVANYHSSKFLKISKVVLTDFNSKSSETQNKLVINVLKSPVSIAPGQIYSLNLELRAKTQDKTIISECSTPESPWDVKFTLKVTTSVGVSTLPIAIRCRTGKQSFLYTFLDHDGSVQQAAAIQPLQDCPGGVCPTVLSLHGTSIPPQNQADSYKHMVTGQFVFGFPRGWTLAPTRHGAHNWEGPGLLTAISALGSLEALTQGDDWLTNKADSRHVLFAGHSMGGHGAWHAAIHYPDRALALIALAGWIKKEEYGDSNLFFRHDISASHVDPFLKSILESCIVENDADQHASNLASVPVVARIGAEDRNVHPWFVRRMYRLLKEAGVKVNYTEVKDKEHWWWDTLYTNDGGAVNDKYLRDFTNFHIDQYLDSQAQCTSDVEGCLYSSDTNMYTNKDEPDSLCVISFNPALGEGVGGVRILQQIVPHRKSEIQVEVRSKGVYIYTRNAARFSVAQTAVNRFGLDKDEYYVDDQKIIPSIIGEQKNLEYCKNTEGWSSCREDLDTVDNRGPLTMGPARLVAEQPFRIIIGTGGSLSSQTYIRQVAVYIANLFLLTSDGHVDIVADTDVQPENIGLLNAIILGNSTENIHTESILQRVPIKMSSDGVQLGRCWFSSLRTGLLSLIPLGPAHLGLVLLGTSREGLQDVVSLATPTIPPMTRSPFSNLIPDYVITGPDFGLKGPGGYLCAGFYGNHWQFQQEVASCVC
ncbi:uncharacterized protein LOC128207480 isoform X2 [Mya arenaria]|uniref:uncharacterized protein LOC128207480 isoform X2 n=1 Tax=Mya arenaria TaxID=6604 RepID=UPI0022E71EFE|nr:uncharacterized protein LOC128207480 isoform X2 [Mya arenaria]